MKGKRIFQAEVGISMEFLVQYAIEGSEKIINKIVNSCWIIKTTNESDFNGIEEMHVFDVTDLGKIKPLYYRGWQPGCLIEYVDDKNNVVIHGYGTDH